MFANNDFEVMLVGKQGGILKIPCGWTQQDRSRTP